MFRVCFVWVYIIKGEFVPFVKSAGIGRLCKRTFARLLDSFSHLPEVVLHKGKQNGLFRVLLSYNFLRQCAGLLLIVSERLGKSDQLFKKARQR